MSERASTAEARTGETGSAETHSAGRGRRSFLRRLLRDRSTTLPLLFLLVLVLMAAGADLITRYDPLDPVSEPLQPASGPFPLGTDEIGRDILTRVIYASRITLAVGSDFLTLCADGLPR